MGGPGEAQPLTVTFTNTSVAASQSKTGGKLRYRQQGQSSRMHGLSEISLCLHAPLSVFPLFYTF